MHIAFIQPRYPWSRRVYLPNGILSMAARVRAAGHQTTIIDENVDDHIGACRDELRRVDVIGISILGPPYAPEALRVAATIRHAGFTQPIIFGGMFVNRLSAHDQQMLFAPIGNVITALPFDLPSPEETSSAPALESLPDHLKRAYFTHEWALYTSTGCIYACNFCAAENGVPERFRKRETFEDEVACLARLTRRYAGNRPNYDIYLSTLDGFQTPGEMEWCLYRAHRAFDIEGVQLSMRCLATSKCTVKAAAHDADLLSRWRGYGLTCVGLGVDGTDPAVWRRENKRHNNAQEIRQAFVALRVAGIQPEALMVIGFPSDSLRSLVVSGSACLAWSRQGIRVRPYLAKTHTVGTKGWAEDSLVSEFFLTHPEVLRELDYASCASPITHSNCRKRWMANVTYLSAVALLKMTSSHGCPTQPLLPTETITRPLRSFARAWNRLMPGDK